MSGDDLFSMADERSGRDYAPLAVRMRPESLDDIYGQDDLIGPGCSNLTQRQGKEYKCEQM